MQACPLAQVLVAKTVGANHYSMLFHILAVVECIIGLLFLVPKLTHWAVGLLLVHMVIVCEPIVLIPNLTWSKLLVPTLEGQYIIKNLALVAVALGILKQHEVQISSR